MLAQGLIKRIGSGTQTNIWQDNWLPRDYKLQPICARSANPPSLVSDLIDPTIRSWNKHVIMEHFIAPDVEVIMNIPLSTRIQEDFWAWHYDERGVFSVDRLIV